MINTSLQSQDLKQSDEPVKLPMRDSQNYNHKLKPHDFPISVMAMPT